MNIDYKDIELTCTLCGSLFDWTSGEQSFMNDLKNNGKIQFIVQPKRCPSCRQKRKEERESFNSGYPT